MTEIARLPYDAASGAEIDDTYLDNENQSASGISAPNTVRKDRIRTFHLTIAPAQVAEILAIHDTHRARWPVAVRDWGEYVYTDQELDYTQDTSSTFAPLWIKKMPATGTRYRHSRILIPDENEVPTVIKVDGVPLLRSDWVFEDFGIVVIPNTHVSTAATITASGRNLVAARFVGSSLTRKVTRRATYEADGVTVRYPGMISLPDVQLHEILEIELIAAMAQTDDSA